MGGQAEEAEKDAVRDCSLGPLERAATGSNPAPQSEADSPVVATSWVCHRQIIGLENG